MDPKRFDDLDGEAFLRETKVDSSPATPVSPTAEITVILFRYNPLLRQLVPHGRDLHFRLNLEHQIYGVSLPRAGMTREEIVAYLRSRGLIFAAVKIICGSPSAEEIQQEINEGFAMTETGIYDEGFRNP